MDHICQLTVITKHISADSKIKISLQILCLHFFFLCWVFNATSFEICWDIWLFSHSPFLKWEASFGLHSTFNFITSDKWGFEHHFRLSHCSYCQQHQKLPLTLRITDQLLLHHLRWWCVLSKGKLKESLPSRRWSEEDCGRGGIWKEALQITLFVTLKILLFVMGLSHIPTREYLCFCVLELQSVRSVCWAQLCEGPSDRHHYQRWAGWGHLLCVSMQYHIYLKGNYFSEYRSDWSEPFQARNKLQTLSSFLLL